MEESNQQTSSMSKKMTLKKKNDRKGDVSSKKEVESFNSITNEELESMRKDAHKFYKQVI